MLMELENKDAREIIDFVDRYLSYSNTIEFNSYNNGNLSINKLETNGSMYWHKAAYLYDYVDSSDFSVSNNIIHYIIEACKLIKKENKLDDLFDMLIQFLKEDVEWGFTNVAVGVIIYIIPKCLPELKQKIDIFRFELKLNSIDSPFVIDNYPLSYNAESYIQKEKYDPDFDFSALIEIDEKVYSEVFKIMNTFVEHMQLYINKM